MGRRSSSKARATTLGFLPEGAAGPSDSGRRPRGHRGAGGAWGWGTGGGAGAVAVTTVTGDLTVSKDVDTGAGANVFLYGNGSVALGPGNMVMLLRRFVHELEFVG